MGENKEKITNELEAVILALSSAFEQEAQENNRELIQQLLSAFKQNEELYESNLELTFLDMQSFAALPWLSQHPEVKDGKDKFIIQSIYSGTFSHFVRTIIERNEGSMCSGDKEHFIIRQVKKAIATGQNQSLYATYEGCDRIVKEKWNEKAYWSPTSFKDTDEVIARFWSWYQIESERPLTLDVQEEQKEKQEEDYDR